MLKKELYILRCECGCNNIISKKEVMLSEKEVDEYIDSGAQYECPDISQPSIIITRGTCQDCLWDAIDNFDDDMYPDDHPTNPLR